MFLDLLPGHSGFQRRHRRPYRVDQARTAARRQVRAGRLLRPEDRQPHLDHAQVRRRPRQGETGHEKQVVITGHKKFLLLHQIIWLGGKVPQDRTIVRDRLMVVHLVLYMVMVLVVVVGCLFAVFLIYFNFKYSHRRWVRCSLIHSDDLGLKS